MKNEEPILRSYNYVDVHRARQILEARCGYPAIITRTMDISFDDSGKINPDPLLMNGVNHFDVAGLMESFIASPAGYWVYNILDNIGWPIEELYLTKIEGCEKKNVEWTPRFYTNGRLFTDDLVSIIGAKDVDILHERLQEVGFEPIEKETTEKKPEIEYFQDRPDFSILNANMRSLIESDYSNDAPPQSTFVIEECSELVTELMKLLKLLCKEERQKADRENVFGEACDVMATIMMYLVRNGYPTHDVFTYIAGNYRRAAERYSEKKEV